MTRILLLLLALCGGVLAYTTWHAAALSRDLTDAQRIIGTLSAGIESRDKAISRLQEDAGTREQNELALRQLQGRAAGAALHREMQIQRENDADKTLRDWATVPLPAAAVRLHSRPAFSNARDYLDWLSSRDKLPDPGQQPEDQR